MRRYLVLIAMAVILAFPSMVHIPVEGNEERARDVGPDLRIEVNIPENGGRYQKEKGLFVNVTIFNDGGDMGSTGANLTMVIKTLEDEIVIFSTLPRPIGGLGSGENITLIYQNWTGITIGRFICNVTVAYPGDANMSNNNVEHTFSVWSDYFPFPPNFETGSVSKLKGDTGTLFKYEVEYKFNKIPNWIYISIDGVNHSMVEKDPDDDIPDDGKAYIYNTTLDIGNHYFRFYGNVSGYDTFSSPFYKGPWVNVSLDDQRVSPTIGYVTTEFLFTVNYGSDANLPPDSIYVMVNGDQYNMSRSSPTPNYQSGNVEFKTRVLGLDMIPGPIIYSFHVETGPDVYDIGPFSTDGPRMKRVVLRGNVTDLEDSPLASASISLDPGPSTTTGPDGRYSLETYVGKGFSLTFSKEGYLPRNYDVDLTTDWNIDVELEPLPVGGTIMGNVSSNIIGYEGALEGAMIEISGPLYSDTTYSGPDGTYQITGIPAGSDYSLIFSESRHITRTFTVDIEDGKVLVRNVTLSERDLGISITPDPVDDAVDVDQKFLIEFPSMVNISTVAVNFFNSTGTIPAVITPILNTTILEIRPSRAFGYDQEYSMRINEGVRNLSGDLILWRDIYWDLLTILPPIGGIEIHPAADSENVPLDTLIRISFGIRIDRETFDCSIYNMDTISGALNFTAEFADSVNWSDSGRTNTLVTIDPEGLTFYTRYSVEISSSLLDSFGRPVLSTNLEFGFTTEKEMDSDGDGVPDSEDPFPDDPNESKDSDKDGIGDNSDLFPLDPSEWSDLDGDGVGDNTDEDDDGDGMPDQWEIDYGLDPADPADAFVDADDDGAMNIDEFLAGTDPNDRGSKPDSADEGETSLLIIISAVLLVLVVVVIGSLFLFGKIGAGKKSRRPHEDPFMEE